MIGYILNFFLFEIQWLFQIFCWLDHIGDMEFFQNDINLLHVVLPNH